MGVGGRQAPRIVRLGELFPTVSGGPLYDLLVEFGARGSRGNFCGIKYTMWYLYYTPIRSDLEDMDPMPVPDK